MGRARGRRRRSDGLLHDFERAATRAGNFEREQLRIIIDLLAQTTLPAGYVLDEKCAEGIASDIGTTADEVDGWPYLRLLARHLGRLQMKGRSLERVLAQLMGVSTRAKDDAALTALLALVPAVVSWDILAYNLACHHALRGKKSEMLRFVKRSLELGKSPTQFAADADFEKWATDEEFAALMKSVE